MVRKRNFGLIENFQAYVCFKNEQEEYCLKSNLILKDHFPKANCYNRALISDELLLICKAITIFW